MLPGFAKVSASKLIANIENSKTNSPDRLLFALGIKGIGQKNAQLLDEALRQYRKAVGNCA